MRKSFWIGIAPVYLLVSSIAWAQGPGLYEVSVTAWPDPARPGDEVVNVLTETNLGGVDRAGVVASSNLLPAMPDGRSALRLRPLPASAATIERMLAKTPAAVRADDREGG